MLYPVESIMQSGKLAALARGDVIGILGDTQVIGTAKDQPGPQTSQIGAFLASFFPSCRQLRYCLGRLGQQLWRRGRHLQNILQHNYKAFQNLSTPQQ
jgi:hypothetical protein